VKNASQNKCGTFDLVALVHLGRAFFTRKQCFDLFRITVVLWIAGSKAAGRYAGEMFEGARYDGAAYGTVLTSEMAQSARTGMSQAVEVSVVIPCLNESELPSVLRGQSHEGVPGGEAIGEVVVADNGSTDGSIRIAEEHGARVIRVAERGYGPRCARASPAQRPFHHHGGCGRQLMTSPMCRDS